MNKVLRKHLVVELEVDQEEVEQGVVPLEVVP